MELKNHVGLVDRFPRLSSMSLAAEKLTRFLVGVGVTLIGLEIVILNVIAPWALPACSRAARESPAERICFTAGGLLAVGVGVAAIRWAARRSREDTRCLTSAELRRYWKAEWTIWGVFWVAALHAGLADTITKAVVVGVAGSILSSTTLKLILQRH